VAIALLIAGEDELCGFLTAFLCRAGELHGLGLGLALGLP